MNAAITKLEMLTNQYNSVLTQYQTTYEQYVVALKTSVKSENSSTNTNVEDSLQVQQYQEQLQQYNEKLIDINNQIIIVINDNAGIYKNDIKNNIKAHKILAKNYNVLMDERRVIDNGLKNYETMQQELDNSDIYTTESYTRYIILLGITIVLFFLLFKYALLSNPQSGGGNDSGRIKSDIIFLLCTMIVFLGLANIFKDINLLIFLTVIIVIYIFIKIKIN